MHKCQFLQYPIWETPIQHEGQVLCIYHKFYFPHSMFFFFFFFGVTAAKPNIMWQVDTLQEYKKKFQVCGELGYRFEIFRMCGFDSQIGINWVLLWSNNSMYWYLWLCGFVKSFFGWIMVGSASCALQSLFGSMTRWSASHGSLGMSIP
jgi:hypothetical protein